MWVMPRQGSAGLVRSTDEGDARWFFGGGVHLWKATAEETAGAFLLFEDRMDAGKVTPLHTHPSDETIVVLSGEIMMHLDGADHHVGTGGLALAPRGVPHAFMVTADETRLLCLHTPGSCEAFYRGASVALGEIAAADRTVDFDRVRRSAHDNGGIEITGPPPFRS
jgi:mannose-6-phosphate isomerase-like protein (cupin superfamily)